jgi:hypothetical protein
METVNFQCGHCGNLMAVGTDNLGQQVRCPHCQQVVVAPPPAPAPAPATGPSAEGPTFPLEVAHDHEDIFAPPAPTEDLFDAPRLPRLEMPPVEPAPAPPPANGPLTEPGRAAPEPPRPAVSPPAPGGDVTLPVMPGAPLPPGDEATLPLGSVTPGPHWMEPTLADVPPLPQPAAGSVAPAGDDLAVALPRPARRPSGGGGWFIPLIFVPLLVYAVLVTITAVVFWRELKQRPPNPFDAMPDVGGDTPGARKDGKNGKTRTTLSYDRELSTAPLPAHLVTALGKPLRVGDLEVTPTKVERRRVRVFVSGFDRPEPCDGDSLVLHLRLRNLATGYAFTPLDNYFDRWWRPPGGLPPLTLLEAGKDRFYGGPAHWYPRDSRDAGRREWVEGRKDFDTDGLAPGAEQESFVCTDGNDPQALRVLFGEGGPGPYKGPLLWRVQVRRGLFDYRGRRVPAAAVVGVAFDSRDVGGAG